MAFKSESEITWKNLEVGSIVVEPGSAEQYPTGGWRSQRSVHENDKCSKCGLCFIYCPEGCKVQLEDGYFDTNLFYCKGCGICAYECPKDAISMVEEDV